MRIFTPQDGCALINAINKQLNGVSPLTATDTSSFVSVGETLATLPKENLYNAMGMVMGKLIVGIREYTGELNLIESANFDEYSNVIREVLYYSLDAMEAGDWNTDIHVNLKTGFDNGVNGSGTTGSVGSMWEQRHAMPLELTFGGSVVWDYCITLPEDQANLAFRSPAELSSFYNGMMTSVINDITMEKDAFKRTALLNYMAGIYDLGTNMKDSSINLTAEFNAKYGTNYTSAQLRTTYLKEFTKFVAATIKHVSDRMSKNSSYYHLTFNKTEDGKSYSVLNFAPKSAQKFIAYQPFFNDVDASVMSEIFNPQYLSIKNYQGVEYWQSFKDDESAKINVTPAIPSMTGSTKGTQVKGNAVALEYVLGVIFDDRACKTSFGVESVNTTPLEARKRYRNQWYHFRKYSTNNFAYNGCLLYMADSVG